MQFSVTYYQINLVLANRNTKTHNNPYNTKPPFSYALKLLVLDRQNQEVQNSRESGKWK